MTDGPITSAGHGATPPPRDAEAIDLALRKSDVAILGALTIVAATIAWQATTSIRDTEPVPGIEFIENDADPNSIAVLSLENLSTDPEQWYFVYGMQDALINGLSRVGALKVASKTSTMRYRNSEESLPRIGAIPGRTVHRSPDQVGAHPFQSALHQTAARDGSRLLGRQVLAIRGQFT